MTAWKSAAGLKTEGRPLANPVVREEGDDRAREKPFRAAPQLWGACCLAGRHLRAAAFLPWGNGDPPRFHYSTKSEWSLCSNQKIRTARARSIGATLWICQRPQHAPYEFPIIRCPTGRAEESIVILCRQELFLSCASIRSQQTGNKNHAGKQIFVIRRPGILQISPHVREPHSRAKWMRENAHGKGDGTGITDLSRAARLQEHPRR